MESVLIPKRKDEFLLDNATLDTLPYEDTIIQNVVSKIKEQKIQFLKEDTLGVLFERFIREERKKDLGQFYTPQKIVDYIIDFLKIGPNSKILDPTCGCGVFLVTAFNFLKQINKEALNNVYGVDLNESATKITRINLWLRNGKNLKSLKTLEKNIKMGNSIVEDKNLDAYAFNWKGQFSDILKEGGFDFVIGNPPYITLKGGEDYNLKESFFSKITNGSTNAASLVIAKSFELLKNNGVMAFVLPKTLVRVNSYSKLREFILNNGKILHIYDLGNCFKDVRGEQVIIFIKKTYNKNEINQNKVLIRVYEDKNKSLLEQKEFLVPQKLFSKYNNFLMFEKQDYYNLIEKINEQGEQLSSLADIFRGITISPKSSLISKSSVKKSRPIIKGKDISKFHYQINYFLNVDKISNNNFKISQFDKDKIVLQNIFSSEAGIIATTDKSKSLNFDTVTNITIRNKSLDEKYLLGLLNSKLINFFLIYAIYNKSKLTMHTDKVYLGRLPIKKVSKETQKEIIGVVNKLEKTKEKKPLLNMLDKVVYKLYKLNKNEQNLIEESLAKIMSAKSMW
jgi:type I restriction-modification system DNA methylase subunit